MEEQLARTEQAVAKAYAESIPPTPGKVEIPRMHRSLEDAENLIVELENAFEALGARLEPVTLHRPEDVAQPRGDEPSTSVLVARLDSVNYAIARLRDRVHYQIRCLEV